MEFLAEILLQILVWIFQLLGELILQILFEAAAELLGHCLREPFRRPKPVNPWLATLGYVLFGLGAGAISLWLLPSLLIEAQWLRIANLVVTPILAGLLMAGIGAIRRRNGKEIIRLESFAYGACFALAMALVRFVWAH